MREKIRKTADDHSAEWYFRGVLRKIGDRLDVISGRRSTASSSLAASSLIERIRKSLDDAAIEVPNKGIVVPHNIVLRMQWNKFDVDQETTIDKLEEELLVAAADHINDSLYFTHGPLNLTIRSDYFTDGVKIVVAFDSGVDGIAENEINVTMANLDRALIAGIAETTEPPTLAKVEFRFTLNGVERTIAFPINGRTRLTIGRVSSNDLEIADNSVSKTHAAVSFAPDGTAMLADTGSTNGTFINGERIAYGKAISIEHTDKITVGEIDIVWSIKSPELKDDVDETPEVAIEPPANDKELT
jgi:hypothetical protein